MEQLTWDLAAFESVHHLNQGLSNSIVHILLLLNHYPKISKFYSLSTYCEPGTLPDA